MNDNTSIQPGRYRHSLGNPAGTSRPGTRTTSASKPLFTNPEGYEAAEKIVPAWRKAVPRPITMPSPPRTAAEEASPPSRSG